MTGEPPSESPFNQLKVMLLDVRALISSVNPKGYEGFVRITAPFPTSETSEYP